MESATTNKKHGKKRRKKLWITLSVLLIAAAWIVFGSGRFLGVTIARPLAWQELNKAFRQAKQEALADIRSDGSWGGVYTKNDPDIPCGHETIMVISPSGYYTYEARNCMDGGRMDIGYSQQRDNSVIELNTRYYNNRKYGYQKYIPIKIQQLEMIVIPWGDREYLMSAGTIPFFKKAIESGEEPRDAVRGNFLLRDGDWRHKVSGKPEFPKTSR